MSHLPQYDNHLHSRSVLITQHMVSKHGAWISEGKCEIIRQFRPSSLHTAGIYIPVPTNGHAFENTVCGAGDYVVEFVGHATWAGHVGHAARTIKRGGEDVIQHASSVPDLETAWLDSSDLDKNRQNVSSDVKTGWSQIHSAEKRSMTNRCWSNNCHAFFIRSFDYLSS